MPAGVSFNASTLTISGTPTSAGVGAYTFSVTVSNDCGSATHMVTITVSGVCAIASPTITGADTLSGTIGTPLTYSFTTSGTITATTISGTLPAGVTFNPTTYVISGTPTAGGTFSFTVGVSNACGSATKTVTITITGGSCAVPLPTVTSPLTASGTVGSAFTYTLTTSGTVSGVTVSGLPAGLSFNSTTNVISGTPTTAGTHSVTVVVTGPCGSTTVTIVITVDTPGCTVNCGGGGCTINCGGCVGACGGGPNSPTVLLMKAATSTLASYGFIYLAKVPYTGLGDGLLTILFLGLLLLISMAVSYAFVYPERFLEDTKNLPNYIGSFFGGLNNSRPLQFAEVATPLIENEYTTNSSAVLNSAITIPARTAFEVPVVIEKEVVRDNVSISEDISSEIHEGLISLPKNLEKRAPVTSSNIESEILTGRLMEAARQMNAILEKTAVEPILIASERKEENAKAILNQITVVAREWYPSASGEWLILSKDKVNKILFSTYLTMLPVFISWLAMGKSEKLFSFLRMLNLQGHSISEFVKQLAYELDAAYRFRLENAAGADGAVVEATGGWNRNTFEKVISSLVTGMDGSYSSDYTAAKLAFGKALEATKREEILKLN